MAAGSLVAGYLRIEGAEGDRERLERRDRILRHEGNKQERRRRERAAKTSHDVA